MNSPACDRDIAQSGVLPELASRVLDKVRDLGRSWRSGLRNDWWVSPACAFFALFYIGVIHVVLTAI